MSDHLPPEPRCIAEMCSVESIKLFLWRFFIDHGKLHLAHLMLTTGTRAMEALRAVPHGVESLAWGLRDGYGKALSPWLGAVLDARNDLSAGGAARDWCRKLERHRQELLNLANMLSRKPLPCELTAIEPGSCLAPKDEPCSPAPMTDARSTAAQNTTQSVPSASPSQAGVPSTPGPNGQPMAPVRTESMNVTQAKAASKAHKKLRGTGHPKRSNPYTKPKRR